MIWRDLTLSSANLLLRIIFMLWVLFSCCCADCGIENRCPHNEAECSPYFYGDNPRSIHMRQSQNESLKCCVAGRPTPFITWLKDGERLTGNRRPENIKIRAGGARLTIIDAVSGLDGGMYSCVASNNHSSVTYNVHVTVSVHVSDIIVTDGLENIVVYEGENITASFNTVQAGTSRIYWMRIVHNYDPLTNETKSTRRHLIMNDRISFDSGGKRMIIQKASANDSGLYRVDIITRYDRRTLNFTVHVISLPQETTNPIVETSIRARQTSSSNFQTSIQMNETGNDSIPTFHQAKQTTVPNIQTSIQARQTSNWRRFEFRYSKRCVIRMTLKTFGSRDSKRDPNRRRSSDQKTVGDNIFNLRWKKMCFKP